MIQTHNFPFGAVWKESLCKQALFSAFAATKKNPEGFFLPLIAVHFIENLLIPLILRLKLCKQVGPILFRAAQLISRLHASILAWCPESSTSGTLATPVFRTGVLRMLEQRPVAFLP